MNRYSPSRIHTFDTCPLKFKNHYIDHIEVEEPISYPAEFGSFIHAFAEHYDGTNTKKLIKLVRDFKFNNDYKDLIVPTLRNVRHFLEKYSKYKFQPEQEFTYKKDIWLYGIVDRIMVVGDKLIFVDYKTSKWASKDKHMFQMSFYNFMISKKYDRDPRDVMCIIYFPRPNAEEKIAFTKTKFQKFESDIHRKIEKIESNTDWPAKKNGLCGWCKYANTEYCPLETEKRI